MTDKAVEWVEASYEDLQPRIDDEGDPFVHVHEQTFERARWIDGQRRFLAEWDEDGGRWELRLRSEDGRRYHGEMIWPGHPDDPSKVEMERWDSPERDETLLVGTWDEDNHWRILITGREDER